MPMLYGAAEFTCSQCGHSLTVDSELVDLELVGADEREMGPEIIYRGEVDVVCVECNQPISLSYDASEYPIGIANYQETNAEGAEVVLGFSSIDVRLLDVLYSIDQKSQLILPEEKKIIVDLGSGISALLHEVNRNPEILFNIEPRKFEELIAHILALHGFKVELTKRSRDGGKDIIAIRSDLGIEAKYIIECKRHAPGNPIGVELVRALHGVQTQEGANKAILATTSRFTADAKRFASATNTTKWAVSLKDFHDIREWVNVSVKNSR